ncbi:MAG: cell division control protein Cdc6 [Thermoprotei archaeon]|nr:MAG: cell division control protein Cdc6 [Thermoprotei archaeon]
MSDVLRDIFERSVRSRIFKDRKVLLPDYVPDELPHREEQIKKLGAILAPVLRGERPSNVFIYGLTGTGKTAVTKFVIRNLMEYGKKIGLFSKVRFASAYVNCRQDDTTYRVIYRFSEEIGCKLPFTGLSTAEAYRRLMRFIDRLGLMVIVILDEIDFLVRKRGDELLYRLTRANDELRRGKISIVGITNKINFIDTLDARVRSSLSEEELVFPPYNAIQLEDILRSRAKLAFHEGAIDEGVISLCASLAAKEHGDARKALDLLRVASEIAEREGAPKVTIKHVHMARAEIEKDRVTEVVKTLPLHSKIVLLAITQIYEGTTGEIYNRYKVLCRAAGLDPVTQRRVSDIISELDMIGLVNAKVVSRGRYGKTRITTLNVPKHTVLTVLSEDMRLASLIKGYRYR